MSDTIVKFNDKGLQGLIKAFGKRTPTARVGVLEGHTARKAEGEESNAEIGAKHEFGEDGMPMRSFLRMPITEHLQEYLEKSGAFTPAALQEVIRMGSLEKWIAICGVAGEDCVAEAFNTGGFGQWRPSNMENKVLKQTLVETQQLRNSITSEVVS